LNPVKTPKEWSVYLARCADDSLYTGIAKDVVARISAHNSGKGAAYTRSRRPVSLVYHKKGLTRSAALIEEARIKSLERAEKLALLKKAVRTLGRAAGILALLWSVAVPARAVPVFDKETTISIASATAQAFVEITAGVPYPVRMYYLPAISSGAPHASSGTAILSATWTGAVGVPWVAETGVRVTTNTTPTVSASSITGCALQPLTAGGYRMLYSIVSTTGAFRIHTATSADGLAWGNQAGVAVDGVTTYVGVPRLVVLNSGDWRMYYTRDANGGDDLTDRQIFTARSTDEGATWGASTVVLSTNAYESGAAKLTDGKVRLFYTQPAASGSSATVIMSALSTDILGTTFTMETGARLSTPTATGAISFPVPVRTTDTYRWRLYYTYYEAYNSTGNIHTALTGAPAPVALTPATVFRTSASNTLAISGEVFSPIAGLSGASITKGAATIVGTGVARTDDQNMTATFNTNGAALGSWDLTVTNSEGASATVVGALTVDFAPGSVVLTDNLLRPRNGGSTAIDVTTFDNGRVSVRVYDSEGRPIRTIFDDEHALGAFGFTWDGKNASGAAVPSGLYFVAVNGPKINIKSKIIVIR
jgi:predicted GIY-YIG superfamily endonuclease